MTRIAHTEILIATSNEGKIREIKQALLGLPLQFRMLNEISDIRAVSEVGSTYEENATLKALGYAKQTGLYALADDSGLEVDVLGGLPGLYSGRYGSVGGSNSRRNQQLLSALEGIEIARRTARFVSLMVLAGPIAESKTRRCVLTVTTGVCVGRIAFTERGSNGFGYDPVFVPEGYQETFGELTHVVKNRISHRAQALFQARRFLETWIGKLDRVPNGS